MKTLAKTDKTTVKLLDMARELNAWDGSHDWANTFDIDEADDILSSVPPSKLISAMFFGNIENCVSYTDVNIRFDAYENFEIVSSYTLKNEAWDDRDDIITDYRDEFGADKLDEAMNEMDTDEE